MVIEFDTCAHKSRLADVKLLSRGFFEFRNNPDRIILGNIPEKSSE